MMKMSRWSLAKTLIADGRWLLAKGKIAVTFTKATAESLGF
jgi:hypothetical protein